MLTYPTIFGGGSRVTSIWVTMQCERNELSPGNGEIEFIALLQVNDTFGQGNGARICPAVTSGDQ